MKERTEQLKAIMAEHGLSCRDVATILGRKEQTVLIWRCSTDANKKAIPAHLLELLELKLTTQAH